jgi:hypothetical protein
MRMAFDQKLTLAPRDTLKVSARDDKNNLVTIELLVQRIEFQQVDVKSVTIAACEELINA